MTKTQPNNLKPIVRAVDVGYGFTKFTLTIDKKGEPEIAIFPSIALKQSKQNLGAGFLSERDTVEVVHNGITYEVGNDAILLAKDKDTRNLNGDYIMTNDYAAIMKATLKKMNTPVIDLLVLGAPVSASDEMKEYLKNTWTGTIDIDNEKIVLVRGVTILPQPLGGFILHGMKSNSYRKLKQETNLIIDPGFLTVDWILINNMKAVDGDSDDRGMGVILNELALRIGAGASNLQVISRIDEALRKDMQIKFQGKEIDLAKYLPYVNEIIEKSVETLITRLGGTGNIQNVFLIGGGARLFKPALETRLKEFEIIIPQGGSYSNVLGYHLAGESIVNKE